MLDAAPEAHAQTPAGTITLAGRVREAGSRRPLADVSVVIVPAPADARPGTRAHAPLEPEGLAWLHETTTDAEGEFEVHDIPPGPIRVVVLAPDHERIDRIELAAVDAPLQLFASPRSGPGYRTEVVSARGLVLPEPTHVLDGQQARSTPGAGGDPLRAAQNLPGVARAPGGLGLLAIRGGDPRQTGIYLEGHPVPRAFHVLPLAAVVDASMVASVELSPGNYDAAYGGHPAGILDVRTRSGPLAGALDRGIHGEAHVDLFDLGAAFRGPVGPGAVAFAFRRSHVGAVVETADTAIGDTGILVPDYWDYIGRFDLPLARRHRITLEMLGAGDALQETTTGTNGQQEVAIDFRTSFHRGRVAYVYERPRTQASLSAALLFDDYVQRGAYSTSSRHGRTLSLRSHVHHRLSRRATLLAGFDLADVHATRTREIDGELDGEGYETRYYRFGAWLGSALEHEGRVHVVVRPQVRLNVFGSTAERRVAVDPRLDLRARVHARVELFAALGQYSAPVSLFPDDQLDVLSSTTTSGAHIVIPDWLVQYFDPGVDSEPPKGALLISRTYHASLGLALELPAELELRTTAFWRETPEQIGTYREEGSFFDFNLPILSPSVRAYGLEFLLERKLGAWLQGMLGYTVLHAQTSSLVSGLLFEAKSGIVPTPFDQRHNLVALLVAILPRHYRIGARFRLATGNPEQPIVGGSITQDIEGYQYAPIFGRFGATRAPTFHQLDLRIDKTWIFSRVSLIGYVDIQNVYNHMYPEIWLYSIDWSQRSSRIGLPIFPSLGIRLEF